jgi:hypothetical protein
MVTMLKRWSQNIAAVLAWLLVVVLALVVLAVGATLYQLFAVFTLQITRWTSTITIQVYYVTVGLAWLGFFIWMENYLVTTAIGKGLLLKRTLFAIGLELAAIALIQIGTMAYRNIELWQVATTLAEALAAAGLIYLSRRLKKSAPQNNPSKV